MPARIAAHFERVFRWSTKRRDVALHKMNAQDWPVVMRCSWLQITDPKDSTRCVSLKLEATRCGVTAGATKTAPMACQRRRSGPTTHTPALITMRAQPHAEGAPLRNVRSSCVGV